MSSTAPQIRRLSTAAPRLAQAALQRARLTVVPPRRSRAPRLPFVTFVSVILLAGVIGLLMFNTSMQQASFRETALRKQAADLAVQQEQLQMEVAALGEPARVARAAQRLGMVIPASAVGVLHLGSGRISGNPTPAVAADGIPLLPPPPRKPAELTPQQVKVTAKTDTTAKTDKKADKKTRAESKTKNR